MSLGIWERVRRNKTGNKGTGKIAVVSMGLTKELRLCNKEALKAWSSQAFILVKSIWQQCQEEIWKVETADRKTNLVVVAKKVMSEVK